MGRTRVRGGEGDVNSCCLSETSPMVSNVLGLLGEANVDGRAHGLESVELCSNPDASVHLPCNHKPGLQ